VAISLKITQQFHFFCAISVYTRLYSGLHWVCLRLLQELTHALDLKRIQTLETIGITTERNAFVNNLKPLRNLLHGLSFYLLDLVGTKSIEVRV
jgi:hypothetical protein